MKRLFLVVMLLQVLTITAFSQISNPPPNQRFTQMIEQGSAPSTPSSGRARLYFDTTATPLLKYVTDDGTIVTVVTSASGGVTGSGAANQLTLWSGASTVTGSALLTYATGANALVDVVTTTASANTPHGFTTHQFSADTVGSGVYGFKARGTSGSPAEVSNGDTLLQLSALGYNGTAAAYAFASQITFSVDGVPGASRVPGAINLLTDNGSASATRWQIQATGNLIAPTDNTLDFGASGATRARTGYFGTSVVAPVGTFATSISAPIHTATQGSISSSAPFISHTATWSTTGTYVDYFVNITDSGPANNASLLMQLQVSSSNVLSLTKGGALTITGSLVTGASQDIKWSGRSGFQSSANGLIELLNAAQTGFTRLNFGPATSSFAAIGVNGTTLSTTLGDGTTGGAFTVNGQFTSNAASIQTVITLTDASTIAVNSALGNNFRVTLTNNRTLGAPSSPVNGQAIVIEVIQDGTGSRTLAYTSGAGGYAWGTDLTGCTISSAANSHSFVTFRYNSTIDRWYGVGCLVGFTT